MKKNAAKMAEIYVVLIFFFVISLCLVSAIPNAWISNAQKSFQQVWEWEKNDEGYPSPLFWSMQSSLDSYTDSTMYSNLSVNEELSVLEAAMDQNDYPRYWHGYLLILKPLSIFFSYTKIRYINMFVINILFFWSAYQLQTAVKRKEITLMYLIAVTACFVIVAPVSFQFMASFTSCFVLVIAVMRHCQCFSSDKNLWQLFFAGGMCINFFDFLTFPLVTLAVPLICFLLFRMQEENDGFLAEFYKTVIYSAVWAIGYAGAWITKWLLGSVVLKKNVLLDAAEQSAFRMFGNEAYPLNRLCALKSNLSLLFFLNDTAKGVCFIVVLFAILFLVLTAVMWRKNKNRLGIYMIILVVSGYPYIWYLVFANHSQIHAFFTFRTQLITVFGLLSVAAGMISDLWRMRRRRLRQQIFDLGE